MNIVIEPCCYPKQLTRNLEMAEKGTGVSHFFSYSDWSTDELVPWLFSSVPGCEAVMCMVHLDPRTVYMLSDVMKRTYVSDRESGVTSYTVAHLTIIVQGGRESSPAIRRELRAQLGRYMDEGRVSVCEDNIGFRCLAAGNGKRHVVIQGSVNQVRMEPCCQMYTMTTSREAYNQAMTMLSSKSRTKRIDV